MIRSTTPYKSLSYQAQNYGGRGRPSYPFLKIIKKCSVFGKKGPDFLHPEVKFTIQNIVYEYIEWPLGRVGESGLVG